MLDEETTPGAAGDPPSTTREGHVAGATRVRSRDDLVPAGRSRSRSGSTTQHRPAAADAPQGLTPQGVARLQCLAGNRATGQLITLQLQPLPGRTKRRRLAQKDELAEMDRVNTAWQARREERDEDGHDNESDPTHNPFAVLGQQSARERARLAAKRTRLLNRPQELPRDPRTFVIGAEASQAQTAIAEGTTALLNQLTHAHAAEVARAPDRAAELTVLRDAAADRIRQAQQNEATRLSVGHGRDVPAVSPGLAAGPHLTSEGRQILTGFQAAARTEVNKSLREAQVTFLSGNNPEARQAALTAAAHDVVLAARILHEVYAHVAFDTDKVARLRSANFEVPGLALATSLGAEWRTFLTAAVAVPTRLPFALAHAADWPGCADPAATLRVWHASPAALTSVAHVKAVLDLALTAGNATTAMKLAALLGTPSLPDLAALTTLSAAGTFTADEVLTLAVIGGDLPTTKALRAAEVSVLQCQAFNAKAGPTPAQIAQAWAIIVAGAVDVQQRKELVVALAKAPNATMAHLQALIGVLPTFASRTTISSATVAHYVELGLLIPSKTSYDTNSGPGCAWKFLLGIGGRRIAAEWHIHYEFGTKISVVGTTWKDGANRYEVGLPRVKAPPGLLDAIKKAANWQPGK